MGAPAEALRKNRSAQGAGNKVLLLAPTHAARSENLIGFAVLPIPLPPLPGSSRLLKSFWEPQPPGCCKAAAGRCDRGSTMRGTYFLPRLFYLEKLLIPLNCPFRGFLRRHRLD